MISMDFIANPFRFSSSSSPSFGNLFERVREICYYVVSAILGKHLVRDLHFLLRPRFVSLIDFLQFLGSFMCLCVSVCFPLSAILLHPLDFMTII